MTGCDVLVWCPTARLTLTDRHMQQCSGEADLVGSGFIHGSLTWATDWQAGKGEGAATLKQNQSSLRLVKRRCLLIPAQKTCPSFSQEKRSFRFINSTLKRNYLPTDLNHQQKENRTESSFFFGHLSCCSFFLPPHFEYIHVKINKGWEKCAFQMLLVADWSWTCHLLWSYHWPVDQQEPQVRPRLH